MRGTARSRALRLATRMPHERLVELDRRRRASPVLRAATAPFAALLGDGPIAVASGLGRGLALSPREFGFAHAHAGLLIRGTLEPMVQEAMRRRLAPGQVFYDVGANLGFFALLGARLTGEEGRVHAFEPAPRGAGAVRRHAALNGMQARIAVHECALGARSGRERLLLPGDESWAHLASTGRHPDTRTELEVELAAVDDLVASGGLPVPDVVKIDVEGAEVDVLAGMARTLAGRGPDVICELHDTNRAVADLLTGHGYRLENLDGREPVARARGDIHVLAVRG